VRVLAVANHKGGSGKTTVAVNLAHALAAGGERRVLLVDLDPQGNAGVGLGVDVHRAARTLHQLFHARNGKVADYAAPVSPGLDLVPSNLESASLETELVARVNRERILARAMEGAGEDYDVAILDTPPSLGLLTLNALVASTEVMVVVDCGFFALYGLRRLQETVELVRDQFERELPVSALVNNLDARQNLDRDVAAEIRKVFGGDMLTTVVRRNVKLKEAQSAGRPILDYAPSSAGAEDFRALAAEVHARASAGRRKVRRHG
jgi:chromosome partitioning protein